MSTTDFALTVLFALGDGGLRSLQNICGDYRKGHTSSKGSTKCPLLSMTALACPFVGLCLEHRRKKINPNMLPWDMKGCVLLRPFPSMTANISKAPIKEK